MLVKYYNHNTYVHISKNITISFIHHLHNLQIHRQEQSRYWKTTKTKYVGLSYPAIRQQEQSRYWKKTKTKSIGNSYLQIRRQEQSRYWKITKTT